MIPFALTLNMSYSCNVVELKVDNTNQSHIFLFFFVFCFIDTEKGGIYFPGLHVVLALVILSRKQTQFFLIRMGSSVNTTCDVLHLLFVLNH